MEEFVIVGFLMEFNFADLCGEVCRFYGAAVLGCGTGRTDGGLNS